MRFDTHLHVWWPGDGAAVRIRSKIPTLDLDFSFARTRPALQAARVSRLVLVSAAQQTDDNDRLLSVAGADRDLVAGVIGWLDVEADDIDAQIRARAADPMWLGIRLPLTIHPDRRFIRRPAVARALRALRDSDAIAEILAGPGQLIDVAEALREIPGLRSIVDHAGNPDFGASPTGPWRDGLAALAALPDAVCKISNFWAPGDPPVRDDNALAFYRAVLATFGATRTIAGSNWPPAGLLEPYEASWARLDHLAIAAGLDEGAAAAIRHDNAARLFGKRQ